MYTEIYYSVIQILDEKYYYCIVISAENSSDNITTYKPSPSSNMTVNISTTQTHSNESVSVTQHHTTQNLTYHQTSVQHMTQHNPITTTAPKEVTSSVKVVMSSSGVKAVVTPTPVRHGHETSSSSVHAMHVGLILALVLGICGVVVVAVVIINSVLDDMRKRDYRSIDDMFEF